MLDNLFGNLEEHQEELQERLGGMELESSVMDQAIVGKANARRDVVDIKREPMKMVPVYGEQMEDLIVKCLNDVVRRAREGECLEAGELRRKIMARGLGGWFGE